MHLLVTGGTGFLGRHIVRSLAAQGDAVTILSRRPVPECTHVVGDLCGDLNVGEHVYDVVIHAAGLAHMVPRTHADAARFFEVNTAGTKRLLKALERTGRLPEAIVLVSTVAVYGRERGEGLGEDTPREATDPYGESKRMAEDAVLAWGARHDVRIGIIRLPLVAGPAAPGTLRAMVDAVAEGRYLNVGGGRARRSMVRAADVAAILPQVARAGGTYHLTDGQHPSFAELSAALAEVLGRPTPRNLPLPLAHLGAWLGEALETVTNRPLPLNRRTLVKMTSTLTFSDAQARNRLGWHPAPVLGSLGELIEPNVGRANIYVER